MVRCVREGCYIQAVDREIPSPQRLRAGGDEDDPDESYAEFPVTTRIVDGRARARTRDAAGGLDGGG